MTLHEFLFRRRSNRNQEMSGTLARHRLLCSIAGQWSAWPLRFAKTDSKPFCQSLPPRFLQVRRHLLVGLVFQVSMSHPSVTTYAARCRARAAEKHCSREGLVVVPEVFISLETVVRFAFPTTSCHELDYQFFCMLRQTLPRMYHLHEAV